MRRRRGWEVACGIVVAEGGATSASQNLVLREITELTWRSMYAAGLRSNFYKFPLRDLDLQRRLPTALAQT